jgi:hypothetical protein
MEQMLKLGGNGIAQISGQDDPEMIPVIENKLDRLRSQFRQIFNIMNLNVSQLTRVMRSEFVEDFTEYMRSCAEALRKSDDDTSGATRVQLYEEFMPHVGNLLKNLSCIKEIAANTKNFTDMKDAPTKIRQQIPISPQAVAVSPVQAKEHILNVFGTLFAEGHELTKTFKIPTINVAKLHDTIVEAIDKMATHEEFKKCTAGIKAIRAVVKTMCGDPSRHGELYEKLKLTGNYLSFITGIANDVKLTSNNRKVKIQLMQIAKKLGTLVQAQRQNAHQLRRTPAGAQYADMLDACSGVVDNLSAFD